jgi:hypothetical protein
MLTESLGWGVIDVLVGGVAGLTIVLCFIVVSVSNTISEHRAMVDRMSAVVEEVSKRASGR